MSNVPCGHSSALKWTRPERKQGLVSLQRVDVYDWRNENESEQTFDVGLNSVCLPDCETVEVISRLETFFLRTKDNDNCKPKNAGIKKKHQVRSEDSL